MSLPGKYIYCFIKEKEEINICSSSFKNMISPVYTLPYKEISAVVSNSEIIQFDPTRKNIFTHQRIISKVMEKYTVIPVAFGTVANSKSDIKDIIIENYDQLVEQLKFLKDKSEVGLKVVWNEDYFNKDIENDEIKKLKAKVSGKDEDEVLYEKIELGQLVQNVMDKKKADYINEIYDPLSKLAVSSKMKENVPIKTVFNAFFLVDNIKSELFDQEVEKLNDKFDNKLIFSYTGPWPSYNFINIRINVNRERK